jgi:iron complex outermembrane receptor protein
MVIERPRSFRFTVLVSTFIALLGTGVAAQKDETVLEEILVIGTTPGSGLGVPARKIPFTVRSIRSDELQRGQSLDLTDYLNTNTPSVNINSAQNNPLQPDLLFRGFTASPLLGLPQGVSVYQDGARINEPLGDAVNWDLVPVSAVDSIDLISGSDPLFGLNTLGGALVLNMKDGFSFTRNQAELTVGTWGRVMGNLESGGNDGALGYYVNVSRFEEDGWRAFSDSDNINFYGAMSWRNEASTTLDLAFQRGDSDLRGNGPTPVGLMAQQRDAIFTAPDITENLMDMLTLDVTHFLAEDLQFSGSAFWRKNRTHSFNGDASEYGLCNYSGGAQSLFEDFEDLERTLANDLDIDLEALCDEGDAAITFLDDLEALIASTALARGLDPEDFEPEDITGRLSGTGLLSEDAINNMSDRRQESEGLNGKFIFTKDLFGKPSQLTVGGTYQHGESLFNAVVELSALDPSTRSTENLGVGSFVNELETHVRTESEVYSLYFVNMTDITDRITLTIGGRYNYTDVSLRDRSGERPELNGDHNFSRFNPSLGLTWDATNAMNVYASYSESNRVPTPIELACNEGVFTVEREFAIVAGEDPDDIDFECRLPNAFLADPPLDDVVTRNVELGLRGEVSFMDYQLGLFHATNHDDILFQTTGRSTGLFANVDKTRRWGFESALSGSLDQFDWYASLSIIQATFEDGFNVLSPNHPEADDDDVVPVESGDHIPGIPESLLKFGGDYRFGNLSVGVEAIYNAGQYLRGDESNDIGKVDGVVLLNLRALYSIGENFSLFAKVTNALDAEYENFGLLGENPSEVIRGIDDTPIFLGVGAPRAAWVGLRYRF